MLFLVLSRMPCGTTMPRGRVGARPHRLSRDRTRLLGFDPALHALVLDLSPGGRDYVCRELIRLLKLLNFRHGLRRGATPSKSSRCGGLRGLRPSPREASPNSPAVWILLGSGGNPWKVVS